MTGNTGIIVAFVVYMALLQKVKQPVRLPAGRQGPELLGSSDVGPGVGYVGLAADGSAGSGIRLWHRPDLDCRRIGHWYCAQLVHCGIPASPVHHQGRGFPDFAGVF